jgi:serine/threonine protein kinase
MLANQQGVVKVSDFGLTKALDRKEMAKTFVGTVQYLSPERLKGEEEVRVCVL